MEIEAKQKAMKDSNRKIEGPFIRYLSTSVKSEKVEKSTKYYSSGKFSDLAVTCFICLEPREFKKRL